MYLIVTSTGAYGADTSDVFMMPSKTMIKIECCAFELACRLLHHGMTDYDRRIKTIKLIMDTFHLDLKITRDSVDAAFRLDAAQREHVLGPKTDCVNVMVFYCN